MRRRAQRAGWLLGALLGALAIAGCHKTFSGKVNQPNPLRQPTETLRDSEPVVIITGDMELYMPRDTGANGGRLMRNKRYPLHNEARFSVVSRDRLRFHVQIEHKWIEWADLHSWHAYIVDDTGRRHEPEELDRAAAKHLVSMWDYEVRSVQRNRFGDITQVNDDGWKRRQTLGSLSVFRGTGDFVFYARDLFTPDIRQLKLVLERSGQSFEFIWNFADDQAPGEVRSGLATR